MRIKIIALSLFSGLVVSGCGGGGSGSDSDDSTATPQQAEVKIGYFRDAPVAGLEYSTPTQSGITGEGGSYKFIEGELVDFRIGTLHLGSAKAAPILTPISMTSYLSPTHDANVNMVRVLISLDSDRNPDNGIQIPAETRDYLTNDVDASHLDITADSSVSEFAIALAQVDSEAVVPPKIDAISHFNETVKCALSGIYYGDYDGDSEGIFFVAIQPKDLKPIGLFQPDDGSQSTWYGIEGPVLELTGGPQPLALGSSTDDGEFSDVTFNAEFSFGDLSGSWSQFGQQLGTLDGERFIANKLEKGIKYIGTMKTPGSKQIDGVIQAIIGEDNTVSIDLYDTLGIGEEHYDAVLGEGGEITILSDGSEGESSFTFNIGETTGEDIDETLYDSRGKQIEISLSSCRI